jgi:hypothetical protein
MMITSFRGGHLTTTFDKVTLTASKSGKCGCGKQRTRQKQFWQTLNPFNRNAAGVPKSSAEIMTELKEEARLWKQEPITCEACK